MAIGEQKEQLLRCILYDLFGKGRNTNSIFDDLFGNEALARMKDLKIKNKL